MLTISSLNQSASTTWNIQPTERFLRLASKRKLILSPSKDLITFFGDNPFHNFTTIKTDHQTITKPKLILNAKKINKNLNSKQKNYISLSQFKDQNKCDEKSKKYSQSKRLFRSSEDENCRKLKKQVDLIPKEYAQKRTFQISLSKQKDDNYSLRVSTQNSPNNSFSSINHSIQKQQQISPKNEDARKMVRRILTRNVFGQLQLSKVKFSLSKTSKSLKLNDQQSRHIKRKPSKLFSEPTPEQNQSCDINLLKGQKIFQYTFGSMALMDLQQKDNRKDLQKKLAI